MTRARSPLRAIRGLIRRARYAQGDLLGEGSTTTVWDLPISYAVAGTIPARGLAVAGQWNLAVAGIPQDLNLEVFREGVVSDETGKVVLNLMQQDSSAVRATMRVGFAVGAPVTLPEAGSGTPFPFAVLTGA